MLASKQPRHNFVHIHVAKVTHEIQSREPPVSAAHPEVLHHHSIEVRFLQNKAQNPTHSNSTLPLLDPVKAIEHTCQTYYSLVNKLRSCWPYPGTWCSPHVSAGGTPAPSLQTLTNQQTLIRSSVCSVQCGFRVCTITSHRNSQCGFTEMQTNVTLTDESKCASTVYKNSLLFSYSI